MRDLAATRVRYGYRRLHLLLRREGWHLGKDKSYLLYGAEQLQSRSKLLRRRKMVAVWREDYRPIRPNQAWCMDFVAGQLADGHGLGCWPSSMFSASSGTRSRSGNGCGQRQKLR